MVSRDYRYRCFDDCTQVSLRSRPRTKSFFYTRCTRVNLLCAKYIVENKRQELVIKYSLH